jgi:hypothetical protein
VLTEHNHPAQAATTTITLYHGTKKKHLKSILCEGFKPSKRGHYMGHSTCLSQEVSIAYEYGEYESGGTILKVTLKPDATHNMLADGDTFNRQGHRGEPPAYAATSTYSGNVWLLHNPQCVDSIEPLPHGLALAMLMQEIDIAGRDFGYNGIAQDYASIWWGEADQDPNLVRFPENVALRSATLTKLVGRTCSPTLAVSN